MKNKLTIFTISDYNLSMLRWLCTLRDCYSGKVKIFITSSFPSKLGEYFNVEVTKVYAPFFWNRYWNKATLKYYNLGIFSCFSSPKYLKQWRYIEKATCSEEGFFLRTDCSDVVFQDNPEKYVSNLCDGKIAVCKEKYSYSSSSLVSSWFSSKTEREQFYGKNVYNGGLICAHSFALKVISKIIHKGTFKSYVDQAELAYLCEIFKNQFCSIDGFMTCLTNYDMDSIQDGKFFCKTTNKPWCIVHGEGINKKLLNSYYP